MAQARQPLTSIEFLGAICVGIFDALMYVGTICGIIFASFLLSQRKSLSVSPVICSSDSTSEFRAQSAITFAHLYPPGQDCKSAAETFKDLNGWYPALLNQFSRYEEVANGFDKVSGKQVSHEMAVDKPGIGQPGTRTTFWTIVSKDHAGNPMSFDPRIGDEHQVHAILHGKNGQFCKKTTKCKRK
jgi:hypothetical protein